MPDVRQSHPTCSRCGCPWHGLPCAKAKTSYLDGGHATVICGCPSPYDDDFWNEGA